MEYVVDASVIIEFLIIGTYTPHVSAFFDTIAETDRIIIPEFCLLECTNVIWKQVRFSGVTLDIAHNLLSVLQAMKLNRVPTKRLLPRCLSIAIKHQLAAYDSTYIALASHYTLPLVTLDRPQLRAAQAEGVRTISF